MKNLRYSKVEFLVIDIGAAPGSWSQYAIKKSKKWQININRFKKNGAYR